MNPGATSERVYDALKRHLTSGEATPGDKLDPAGFADRLNSSITPVRDALHRLAGERLVEARASDGFHVPLVTEPALRDLYAWNAQLARLIVRSWTRQQSLKANNLAVDIGRATSAFFDLLAAASPNAEHRRQIDSINDRLATARVAERDVLTELEGELRALAVAFDTSGTTELLKLIAAYHRRRLAATPAIVRAMYRG